MRRAKCEKGKLREGQNVRRTIREKDKGHVVRRANCEKGTLCEMNSNVGVLREGLPTSTVNGVQVGRKKCTLQE